MSGRGSWANDSGQGGGEAELKITGFQSPADDYLCKPLSLDDYVAWGAPQRWLWKVDTDCFQSQGIHRDDLLIVDRSAEAHAGVLVVVALEEGHVLAQVCRKVGAPALELTRPAGDDQGRLVPLEGEATVWGVAEFVLRRL